MINTFENLPVRTHQHKGLTIEGYSRAAVQSYWRCPELRVCFDLGACPWAFTGTPNFFVTHAHLDHLAGLPTIVARRRMMKMGPTTIYMPEQDVEISRRILDLWQRLDRGRMACELVGVKPGDEIELSREHVVTVFETTHSVPSVGYLVWERKKKLKPEFVGLPQDQIRDMKLAGTEVDQELKVPLLCYTGDTTPEALDQYEPAFEARILITEMTFFRPEHTPNKVHKFGHTHMYDIVFRSERFKNELIILSHFSTRYHDGQFRNLVAEKFPPSLQDRVMLWL